MLRQQTLLDEVSPYGYYKDQDHWIGIPLWVHRRSDNQCLQFQIGYLIMI